MFIGKKHPLRSLCASLLFLALANCSRQGAPAQLSFSLNKNQGFSINGDVNFIALNISGGGGRLQSHQWECDRSACDQLSVETLSGSDKLIQLLLVVDKSDGSTDILYGDATATINAGDNRIEIQLNKIADFNQEGSVAGRYIPSAGHPLAGRYLTGRVSIWARVGANKPDMRIQETSIFGGWFRLFLLDTLGFRYTFSGHDFQGTPYIEVPLFNDLHDSSGLRLSSPGIQPIGTRSVRYSSTLPYFKEREAGVVEQRQFETQNIGFYGINPDNSRLCSENIAPSFVYNGSNSSSRLCKNASCSDFFLFSDIAVSGSINGTSNICTGASLEKKIRLNRIEQEDDLLEAYGPFVGRGTVPAFELDVANQRVRWRLAARTHLPRGVELMVRNNSQALDWESVWDAMGPEDGVDCGKLANFGFSSIGVFNGDGNVNVSSVLNPSSVFALCPRRPLSGYYAAGVLFPQNYGPSSPTRLELVVPSTLGATAAGTVSSGICHPLLLKTVDSSGIELPPLAALDVDFSLLPGGAIFRSRSDCQGGMDQITAPIPVHSSRSLFWLRNGAPSGAFTATASDASSSLSSGTFSYSVATPGPLHNISIVSDFMRADVFEMATTELCVPFHVFATDSTGRLVNLTNTYSYVFHNPPADSGVYEFKECSAMHPKVTGTTTAPADVSVATYFYQQPETGPATISGIMSDCREGGSPITGNCVSSPLEVVMPGAFSHYHVDVLNGPSFSNSSCMQFRIGAYDNHRPNSYPVPFSSAGALPTFEIDAYEVGTTDPFPGAEYFVESSPNATCSAGGSTTPISRTPTGSDTQIYFQVRPNGTGYMDLKVETSSSSWERLLEFFINI